MRAAIYAGSFDPVTYGHLRILSKALRLFDKVYVLVAHNPAKKHLLSLEDRIRLFQASVDEEGVEVLPLPHGETVAHKALELNVHYLVRGLRGHTDVDGEMISARINREINLGLETVMFVPEIDHEELSSSLVRGLIGLRGWRKVLSSKVPVQVTRALELIHFKSLLGNFSDEFESICMQMNRPYHNIHHAYDVLDFVYYDIEDETDKEAVVWAALFHDIVSNEHDSYTCFVKQVCKTVVVSDKVQKRVKELILGTDHSKPLCEKQLEDDVLCRFVAADLMILSSDCSVYRDYADKIRKEYPNVSDEEFIKGRIDFLSSMLKPRRNSIFPDNGMFDKEERRSIENMQHEINDLFAWGERLFVRFPRDEYDVR